MSWSNSRLAARIAAALAVPVVFVGLGAARLAAAADAASPGMSLPAALVAAFDRVFKGPYAGERAIHAKGVVLRGTFTAAPDAASLSSAEHLRAGGAPVPVLVRFSAFSGVPSQADGRPGTNPTGMAIKFLLPGNIDTDIVAHSYNGFPVATAEDFLGYLDATTAADPAAREAFLASHPAARRFVDAPKPTPASYATEGYYGVDAFRFTNAAAVSRFGRYRIAPAAAEQHLSPTQAADLKPDFLRAELRQRVAAAPVDFRLLVQLAAPGDAINDPSIAWPADRPEILLGTLSLTQIVDDAAPETKTLFFSPMNLVPGIAASDDPLLAARSRSYSISYRRRVAEQ